MHVIHTAPGYPPAAGGIETYVAGLCRGLAAQGVQVEVLTTRPTEARATEQGSSPRVRRFSSFTLPGVRGYPILPRLPAALLRAHPDVLHGHGLHTFLADAPAATARLRSVPFVLNPYFAPATTVKWRLYQRTVGRLTARADVVVVISRFERRALAAAGLLRGRVELVPPAIRAAEFRGPCNAELLARYGLDAEEHRIVLALGRISRAKGIDLLIDAAAMLSRRMPELRVLVVGPDWGERLAAEERAHAAGLSNTVIFAGALPRVDVRRALRTSAIPEVVDDGNTGLLADADDPAAFAGCLHAVLEDEALARRLSAAGAEHVATYASERAQAARMLELYQSVR